MNALRHKSIVRMRSAWGEKDYLYLLYDFALNGDLSSFLRANAPLKFDTAQYFAAQLVGALAYLRSQRVVHRDIKPANILLNEKWQIQLADFGTAKIVPASTVSASSKNRAVSDISNISSHSANSQISSVSNDLLKSTNSGNDPSKISLIQQIPPQEEDIVGTEHYISPEMIDTKQCGYAGDLWAFGVIIYQFFTGQVPFKGKNQESTFEKIRKGLFEMPKSVPPLAQDLIRKLLTVNPELRLGTADMHDLMSHKFFDGIDFATIHD